MIPSRRSLLAYSFILYYKREGLGPNCKKKGTSTGGVADTLLYYGFQPRKGSTGVEKTKKRNTVEKSYSTLT